MLLISEQDVPAWCRVGQVQCLGAQVAECVVQRQFHAGPRAVVGGSGHGLRLARLCGALLVNRASRLDAFEQNVEVLVQFFAVERFVLCLAVLAQDGYEEAFAPCAMGEEVAIHNAPFGRSAERQDVGPQFAGYPCHVVFVFKVVEGAGGIDELSARTQCRPDVTDNLPLSLPTQLHTPQAPLPDGFGVFAEHAFTGAGRIAQDEVEHTAQRLEVCCKVAGDKSVGAAPLDDVFAQDVCTLAHGFVGNERGVAGQVVQQQCGFSAWRSTEVEASSPLGERIVFQQMADEHGRSLLNIVAAGMKQRVERELRTLCQVPPIGTPRHRLGVGKHRRWLSAVEANADDGFLLECQGQCFVLLVADLCFQQVLKVGW